MDPERPAPFPGPVRKIEIVVGDPVQLRPEEVAAGIEPGPHERGVQEDTEAGEAGRGSDPDLEFPAVGTDHELLPHDHRRGLVDEAAGGQGPDAGSVVGPVPVGEGVHHPGQPGRDGLREVGVVVQEEEVATLLVVLSNDSVDVRNVADVLVPGLKGEGLVPPALQPFGQRRAAVVVDLDVHVEPLEVRGPERCEKGLSELRVVEGRDDDLDLRAQRDFPFFFRRMAGVFLQGIGEPL